MASTRTTVLNISGGIYAGSATDGSQVNDGDQISIFGVSATGSGEKQ